jgi:hypothetical protein
LIAVTQRRRAQGIAGQITSQTDRDSGSTIATAGTKAIMDQYKASVQGVDNALARLNATLASYKISGNLPEKSAADLVKESELASASLHNGTHEGTRGTLGSLKHHIYQVVSKVTSEPVDWETWVSMSDAESLQKYPEVRIIYRSIHRSPVGSYKLFRSTTMILDNC